MCNTYFHYDYPYNKAITYVHDYIDVLPPPLWRGGGDLSPHVWRPWLQLPKISVAYPRKFWKKLYNLMHFKVYFSKILR